MMVQPGDIVFHSCDGILASAIRKVTRCPWSHVSMVVRVPSGNGLDGFDILDVLATRVIHSIDHHSTDRTWHVRSPRYPTASEWSVRGIPMALTREHVVRHALELHRHLRRRYPWMELSAYLPGLRRTAWGRRILRRTDRMVCSAMVATAWHAMDFKWINGDGTQISPDWVDPGTMWRQANRDVWPLMCTKESYNAV